MHYSSLTEITPVSRQNSSVTQARAQRYDYKANLNNLIFRCNWSTNNVASSTSRFIPSKSFSYVQEVQWSIIFLIRGQREEKNLEVFSINRMNKMYYIYSDTRILWLNECTRFLHINISKSQKMRSKLQKNIQLTLENVGVKGTIPGAVKNLGIIFDSPKT